MSHAPIACPHKSIPSHTHRFSQCRSRCSWSQVSAFQHYQNLPLTSPLSQSLYRLPAALPPTLIPTPTPPVLIPLPFPPTLFPQLLPPPPSQVSAFQHYLNLPLTSSLIQSLHAFPSFGSNPSSLPLTTLCPPLPPPSFPPSSWPGLSRPPWWHSLVSHTFRFYSQSATYTALFSRRSLRLPPHSFHPSSVFQIAHSACCIPPCPHLTPLPPST